MFTWGQRYKVFVIAANKSVSNIIVNVQKMQER
jgi:hypothetical protein